MKYEPFGFNNGHVISLLTFFNCLSTFKVKILKKTDRIPTSSLKNHSKRLKYLSTHIDFFPDIAIFQFKIIFPIHGNIF
jgi:hypothetical protein